MDIGFSLGAMKMFGSRLRFWLHNVVNILWMKKEPHTKSDKRNFISLPHKGCLEVGILELECELHETFKDVSAFCLSFLPF